MKTDEFYDYWQDVQKEYADMTEAVILSVFGISQTFTNMWEKAAQDNVDRLKGYTKSFIYT